jgi:hypothetical protein
MCMPTGCHRLAGLSRQLTRRSADHMAHPRSALVVEVGAPCRALPLPRGHDEAHLPGIPPTQGNYFHRFPLARRCWGGALSGADFVHFSSGSSGQPTPWARSADDEAEVAARFEQAGRGRVHAFPLRCP